MVIGQKQIERFKDKIFYSPDGCWYWAGSPGLPWNYGAFKVDGKLRRANRVSYAIFKGDIPHSLHVLHTCDNTLCVNPDHLFLGTPKDNTKDMLFKGRGGYQKIKHTDIPIIREALQAGFKAAEIARYFKISASRIYVIKAGKAWSHV